MRHARLSKLEKLRRSADREARRFNQAAFCSHRDALNKQKREMEKAVARAERSRAS
jgi:hypothetical protein